MTGLLLQGQHGVGKSTLLHRALQQSGLAYGGYYVQRLLQDGATKGFRCRRLTEPARLTAPYDSSMQGQLFIDCRQGHTTTVQRLVQPALAALSDPLPQLLVLDELGGVELLDNGFFERLMDCVGSCTLVGSYKADGNAAKLQRQTGVDEVLLAKRRQQLQQRFAAADVWQLEVTEQNKEDLSAVLAVFLKGVQ